MALKFISKHGKSAKDIRNLRQEIAILRTLNHENIILMFDAFETEREFCVVTEYAQVIRNGLQRLFKTTQSKRENTTKKGWNRTNMSRDTEYVHVRRPEFLPSCGKAR